METPYSIIGLDPARWQAYKQLRLESLVIEPTAFLGTVQEESAYSDTEWQERLINSQQPDKNFMLFAEKQGAVVGMIAVLCDNREKIRHIARMVSFYVMPAERNQGVGKALINAALKAIQERKYITKVSLDVTVTQTGTIKLYEKFGFVTVGRLKNNICVDSIYYDALVMEKHCDKQGKLR